MATTKFEKPMGTEIATLNSQLTMVSQQSPVTSSYEIMFFKVANTVHLKFNGYLVTATGAVSGAVPSGYLPYANWRGLIANSSGSKNCPVYVKTDGTIEFQPEQLNEYYYGSVSYPLA